VASPEHWLLNLFRCLPMGAAKAVGLKTSRRYEDDE
jgi:hypothetical protein